MLVTWEFVQKWKSEPSRFDIKKNGQLLEIPDCDRPALLNFLESDYFRMRIASEFRAC